MSRREEESMNTPDDEMFRAEWDADGHVSEDTVHAWLDRQLGDGDANAVELHIATCANCAERVAEARGLKAATTRIVGSLDVGASGIVPREDVARTASHIVALANAAEKFERANVVVAKRKFWQNPVVLRAAAAVVVMLGGTTLVMRKYSATTLQVASADSAVSTTAAAASSTASAVVAEAPTPKATRRAEAVETRDGTPAAVKRTPKLVQRLNAEPLAKSAPTEFAQGAQVDANAESSVAKKLSETVGRGAVSNAGTTGAMPLPTSLPARAKALADARSGTFTLHEVPPTADSLVARRIGYQSLTSSIAPATHDTAHAAFSLKASTQGLLEEMTTTGFAGTQVTAAACELRAVPTLANPEPIFRLLLGPFGALGNQPVIVVGWPTPRDSVATRMNRTLAQVSFRALKNGAQLDVQLTKGGAGWRGSAEERTARDSRKENIELTANGAASCAK